MLDVTCDAKNAMADEEDYLDLVIAGELVTHWLEEIRSASRLERSSLRSRRGG